MVQQLCGLERRTARSGKDGIDHGPAANAHDDVANAVAGVMLMVNAGRPPIKISDEAMRRFGAMPSAGFGGRSEPYSLGTVRHQ